MVLVVLVVDVGTGGVGVGVGSCDYCSGGVDVVAMMQGAVFSFQNNVPVPNMIQQYVARRKFKTPKSDTICSVQHAYTALVV